MEIKPSACGGFIVVVGLQVAHVLTISEAERIADLYRAAAQGFEKEGNKALAAYELAIANNFRVALELAQNQRRGS